MMIHQREEIARFVFCLFPFVCDDYALQNSEVVLSVNWNFRIWFCFFFFRQTLITSAINVNSTRWTTRQLSSQICTKESHKLSFSILWLGFFSFYFLRCWGNKLGIMGDWRWSTASPVKNGHKSFMHTVTIKNCWTAWAMKWLRQMLKCTFVSSVRIRSRILASSLGSRQLGGYVANKSCDIQDPTPCITCHFKNIWSSLWESSRSSASSLFSR